ncbi:protein sel-1 homolog 3, partial [Cynoglossus semilaevis]
CGQVQMVWSLDQVPLLTPPQEPVSDHRLRVFYSCDKPAAVQLDCVVSFDTGIVSSVPLRQWDCVPGEPRIRTVTLRLPDWLVYQADGIVPDSQWVLTTILQASLSYRRHGGTGPSPVSRDVALLQPRTFFDRPVKQHKLCFPWSTQMLRLTPGFLRTQCPWEEETVHFLSSIYASTGETFGITETLRPYGSEVLEHLRVKAISYSWCFFSIWMFVTSYCQNMCGVFYHIDPHNNYATPTVLLTSTGHLHVQVNGQTGESSAFLTTYQVPLSEWCELSVVLQGRTVTVSMACIKGEQKSLQSTEFVLRHTLRLNDTEGYFVIGGGNFVKGAKGFFGPVVYHRNRIPPHREHVVPDVIKDVNLTGWLQTCDAFRMELTMKINGYSHMMKQPESCHSAFYEWLKKDRGASRSQCQQWETSAPHRRQAAKLVQQIATKRGGQNVSLTAVGRALYTLSLRKLAREGSIRAVSRALPLLLQSGCLGDNRALHLSSVILSAGFGVREQPKKAWLLALLAAQKDERLALLRLGFLHHRGLYGQVQNVDLAYGYYANIGKQTTVDRQKPSSEQTYVEAIYLNNEEVLKQQTHENHHLFQWLKLQARRGTTEAEQAIGRMLFWGQQGVAPDLEKAVRHYQRGAIRWEDPQSMYDYAIVLLQGLGIEKDVEKAVFFLKKAMDKGFIPAMNALAWYHEHYQKDYVTAVELWEQADLLNSHDAAFNLGVLYAQGRYPGKPADQHMAYKYYLKSAERGHIRGTVLLSEFLITGLPGSVDRRPSEAVLWAKWAAEHNGYLGIVLRKALDSYLTGDMFSSLLYYMMAAESGFAVAQFNVAYLCELNPGHFLDTAFTAYCMRKYYNLNIQSQTPDTYALIKMGDLHYEGQEDGQKDLLSAAQMYKTAALRKEPQGWYNLGLLTEEGFKLPLSILTELGISQLYLSDQTLLLSALYKRCRDSDDTDAYLPCSLALSKVYLQLFKKEYSAAIKLAIAIAVVAAPTIFLIIPGLLRRRDLSHTEP